MYIPAGPATLLAVSNKAQSAVTAIEPNRRSNMFAVLRSDSFEIWNVRVSVMTNNLPEAVV